MTDLDREELLKMMMALMEHGWGVDAALAEAERGLQAVNTKCADQPTTIRVKPDPVAWAKRNAGEIVLHYCDGPGRFQLYEPEDA